MNTLGVLRVGLKLYATLLGQLELVTLGWALTSVVVLDSMTLATGWFLAAGLGTALFTVPLVRAFPAVSLSPDWLPETAPRGRGRD